MIIFHPKLLLFILLSFPLLFGGCRKSDANMTCDESNTNKINDHARDFFYFKTGTWWLYEQEGTGLTDSIWVSWSERDYWNNLKLKGACNCGQGRCTEGAGIRFQNKAHNGNDYLCHTMLETSLSEGTTAVEGETPNSRNTFSPLHGLWVYEGNNQLINKSSGPSVFESQDSLMVNGKVYRDILHKHKPNGGASQTYLQEVWFARNFFVVRFRRNDNTYWNLVDYNIVQ